MQSKERRDDWNLTEQNQYYTIINGEDVCSKLNFWFNKCSTPSLNPNFPYTFISAFDSSYIFNKLIRGCIWKIQVLNYYCGTMSAYTYRHQKSCTLTFDGDKIHFLTCTQQNTYCGPLSALNVCTKVLECKIAFHFMAMAWRMLVFRLFFFSILRPSIIFNKLTKNEFDK